jgi:hypothetical protein
MRIMKPLVLRVYDNDFHQSYLELSDFPSDDQVGCVASSINIRDFLDDYRGPTIKIDFDSNGTPIGVEILYSYAEYE